ncbi:hypothetical protein RI367_005101 [Sorochytrium milnesiophthora]
MSLLRLRFVLVVAVVLLACVSSAVQATGACSASGVRIRKSLRALSAQERADFVTGVQRLKANGILDRLTRFHRKGMPFHGTIHFLSMHRALLKDFEDELIKVNPRIKGLPYWDEAVDALYPASSPIFSPLLMGGVDVGVQHHLKQPFADLRDDSNRFVTRQVRSTPAGFTWTPQNQVIARALSRFSTFGDMSRVIEISPHNQFHNYLGGHMGNPMFSPSDPVFWVHHAYIDLLWATWQSLRPQNRENLDNWSGPRLQPDQPVALHEGRYTQRDVLRYQDRLCYRYEVMNIRDMDNKAALLRKRDASNTTTVGAASNSTAAQQPCLEEQNAELDRLMSILPADALNVTRFAPLQKICDEEVRVLMPNVNMDDWRAIESGINDVVSELNKCIENEGLNTTTLKTVHDLFLENQTNCTQEDTDDGKDSAIPAVQQVAAQLVHDTAASSSATSIRFLLPLLVALCYCVHIAQAAVQYCQQGVRRRKSLRDLSQSERAAFVDGMQKLKANGVMDRMTKKHRSGMQYHGTVYFLLMHRALIKEFEDELLKANPGVPGLPYWGAHALCLALLQGQLLDASNPSKSPIFTTSLMGALYPGQLQDIGQPYAGWVDDFGDRVQRQPSSGSAGFSWAPQSQVVARALSRFSTFGDMQHTIEISPHNQYHGFIGGHMGNPYISPADPLFWTHHAYIDYLWAVWQVIRPSNSEDLRTWSNQPQLSTSQATVLYQGTYTNLDMLRYRTRLCYTYQLPANSPSRLSRRELSKRQSDDPALTPPVNASAPFLKVQPMPEDAIKRLMPNMTVADWRAIETQVNNLVDEMNADVQSGKVNPAELATVDSLFLNSTDGNTTALPADDGSHSAIPAIQSQVNSSSSNDNSGSSAKSGAVASFSAASLATAMLVALAVSLL